MSGQENPRLRKNNFDLIRLLLASTVMLVRAYELSGFAALAGIAGVLSSAVAVKAFFVISGFLIFKSFEESNALGVYTQKRLRRIYPAYVAVILLCATGLVIVSTQTLDAYFSWVWIKYIAANLVFLNFLQPTLPGVFEGNNIAAVNGALWTLKIEVLFYLFVPLCVWMCRKAARFPILVAVYLASIAYSAWCANMALRSGSSAYAELARQLPGQLSYFISGAFFYYFLPYFEHRIKYFVSFATFILCTHHFFALPMLEPFALATVVIFFSLFGNIGRFGKYGDFSYGVYILHFPIIQLLLTSAWLSSHAWLFLASAIVLTFSSAFAMWHLVEKRFLARKQNLLTP